MKIALVGNQSKSIYNFRRELISFLLKEHTVIVIANQDEYSSQLVRMGCQFHPVEIKARSLNPLFDLFFFNQLFNILKKLRPDLLISYTAKPNIYSPLVCQALGITCLPVITGLGNSMLRGIILKKLMVFLYKIALKKLPEIWFLNQSDLDFFVSNGICSLQKTRNIHGEGINIDHFKPIYINTTRTNFAFLYFGRILADKGITELLDAFEEVRKKHPIVTLTLVGDFDVSNKIDLLLKTRVLEMNNEGTISYLPSVSDVRQIIAPSDCILLPSYREGLSRALMEAASMAKPIIASNVPGCRELVVHGESGFLLDRISKLCIMDTMLNFIKLEKKQRLMMGKKARAHIKRTCSINNTLQAYSNYIKRQNL